MLSLKVLKKIAVTGGIASGKSAVCRFFEENGAYVLSADAIVHKLLVPTSPLGKKIIALLGEQVVDGKVLDRELIAKKVFSSPRLLTALEKLIHPEVQKVIETEYKTLSQNPKSPFFVVEVPLLYESGQDSFYDVILLVTADEAQAKQRFPGGPEEYQKRSDRLIPEAEKREKANFIIQNTGSLSRLRKTTQTIIMSLKETI